MTGKGKQTEAISNSAEVREENALSTQHSDDDGQLSLISEVGGPAKRLWSNLEVTTVQLANAQMRAMRKADYDADTLPDSSFTMVYLMVHEVDIVDEETGEIARLPRTVIMDKDGKSCAFVSVGIMDSVKCIVRWFGNGPWKPGIPVRIVRAKTRKNFRIYFLEIDDSKPCPKLTGK